MLPALISLALLSSPACGSGVTLFEDAGTRVFLSSDGQVASVCSGRLPQPRAFAGEMAAHELVALRRFGPRVGFVLSSAGGWDAGWVDSRTGEARSVPDAPGEGQAVAVGAGGSIAFLGRSWRGQSISYARNGANRLGRPRVLATVTTGDVVPESLEVGNGMVSWTEMSGATRSAAVARPRATAAAAKVGCSSGTTLFKEGRTRIFLSRDKHLAYVCSAWLKRPRVFANGLNAGGAEKLFAFRRFGRHVGFAISWSFGDNVGWDAGWVDRQTGASRITRATPDTGIPTGDGQAVAVRVDGAIAFLERTPEGQVVGFIRNGARTLLNPRALVTVPAGDIVPESLRVIEDNVTWTTTAGVAGSVGVR